MGNVVNSLGCNCLKNKEIDNPEENQSKEEPNEVPPEITPPSSLIQVQIGTENFVKKRRIRYNDAYEIIQLLGEGAFGSVYKVKVKDGEEIRAMKIISKTNLLDSDDPDSVRNEISVLKKLDHPNVMKIYEFFEDKDNFYLINEFCNGGDLAGRQEKDGIFAEYLVKFIMYQVFLAVNYLHKSNVLHGDIKRENILCDIEVDKEGNPVCDIFPEIRNNKSILSELKNTTENNTEKLTQKTRDFLKKLVKYDYKLVDFGSAKMKKPWETNKKLSGVIGTAYYCAPEVVNNKYSYEADEWSCGVMMYLLLSGEPPFKGDSEEEIFDNVLNSNPNFDSPKLRHVSSKAKDLMKKLLIKNPKERISAEQALKENFFTTGIKIKDLLKGDLDKSKILKKFVSQKSQKIKREKTGKKTSVFRESVIGYIALNFANKQKEVHIKEIFRELSANNPEFEITKETFSEILMEKLPEFKKEELDELFDGIDENRNGIIDYQELVRSIWPEEEILSEQNVEKAFQFFDDNNNGSVSWDEIAAIVFKGKAEKMSEDVMKEFFDEIGITKEEEGINLEDFKKMFVYKPKNDNPEDNSENKEKKEGEESGQTKQEEAKEEHVEPEN